MNMRLLFRFAALFAFSVNITAAQNVIADDNADVAELVKRDRISLTQAGAELILQEAQAKAKAMQKNVNIAIVDDGGHPVLFVRMNDARPASSYTALTKAVSAATLRAPTGPFKSGDAEPNLLLNISLQNASAASGGHMTSLYGGVPIIVDGQVIGAVGVGGATGEEDAQIARAGIEALLKKLN